MLRTDRIDVAFVVVAVLTTPALGADNKAGASPTKAPAVVHVALQIKPGLWEFTDTPKMTGPTILPDAMVSNVPPGRRAQYLAETRQQLAEQHKERECITQAKFEQRLALSSDDCTRTMVLNTPSALDLRSTCRSESHGIKQSTEQKILGSSPSMVTSVVHFVTTRGAESMVIDTTEIGRWLGADCGGLKDDVIQQVP